LAASVSLDDQAESRVQRGFWRKLRVRPALFPVTGLCTACTRLKTRVVAGADFSLTVKSGGVKTESFFDNF
jgi:hypothetical protein